MPLTNDLISIDDTPGYCWRCHKYQYKSVTKMVWKTETWDEKDEFRSCLCPDCGDHLELDVKCDSCHEPADDGVIEVAIKGKTLFLCPHCYLIYSVERAINDLLLRTELSKNEILSELEIVLETVLDIYYGKEVCAELPEALKEALR